LKPWACRTDKVTMEYAVGAAVCELANAEESSSGSEKISRTLTALPIVDELTERKKKQVSHLYSIG
jgi:hypothetical protein